MKKKLVSLVLCSALAVSVLSACGGSNDQGNETSESAGSQAEESAVQESSQAEESGTPDEASGEASLIMYAAASLADVLNDEIALYNETHPDVTITLSTGSSGDLMTQIEEAQGTDIDIFFSAGKKQMNELIEQGLVDEANSVDLLKNEIVLIGAKDSGTSVTGFENITDASSIALADDTVPVGQYAREAFDSLGISEDDFAQVNTCADVSAVKEAVKEGSNEVGIVYYSDYYSVKDDVDLIEICDQSLYSECIYPVATVNNPNADDTQSGAAADFVEFLQTDEAKQIFEDYMFTIY